MQIGDFAYILLVPVLIAPLAGVYVAMRWARWSNGNRFADSFIIWLTWVFSSIAAFLVLAWTYSSSHWFGEFGWVSRMITFFCFDLLANVTTIAFVVSVLGRRRKNAATDYLLYETAEAARSDVNPLSIALLTTFAACISLVLLLYAFTAVDKTYHYFDPPPPTTGFQIYD